MLHYIDEIYTDSRHLSSTVNIGNNLISILLNDAKERPPEQHPHDSKCHGSAGLTDRQRGLMHYSGKLMDNAREALPHGRGGTGPLH